MSTSRRIPITAVRSVVVGVLTSLLALTGFLTPSIAAAAPSRACGTPLAATDIQRIVDLSDTTRDAKTPPLTRLNNHVGDLWSIVDILTSHKDRRGLFPLGLAATERDAVMPMQNRAGSFDDPRWAATISLRLLDRFLAALHAEFTGAAVPSQWRHYFDLAANCRIGGERVALVGYNSHITVDLAYATADSRTTTANARDFFTIVDTIAAHGNSIVSATNRAYAVDLGPTFRFYFVGEGLDRLVGAGRATGPMLRAADVGYNVLTFGNGLALQNPTSHDAAVADIAALWATGDAALGAFEEVGVLR